MNVALAIFLFGFGARSIVTGADQSDYRIPHVDASPLAGPSVATAAR